MFETVAQQQPSAKPPSPPPNAAAAPPPVAPRGGAIAGRSASVSAPRLDPRTKAVVARTLAMGGPMLPAAMRVRPPSKPDSAVDRVEAHVSALKAGNCALNLLTDLYTTKFPSVVNHFHAESGIPKDVYMEYFSRPDARGFYDPKTNFFVPEAGPDTVPVQEAVRRFRPQIESRMTVPSDPKDLPKDFTGTPKDFFFNEVCPRIDAMNALIPISMQHLLTMRALKDSKCKRIYTSLMTDVPASKDRSKFPVPQDMEKIAGELQSLREEADTGKRTWKVAIDKMQDVFVRAMEHLTGYLARSAKMQNAEFEAAEKLVAKEIPDHHEYTWSMVVMRTLKLNELLMELADAFAVADLSIQQGGRVRAIQVVGDEGDTNSQVNSRIYMLFIDYLSSRYPNVNVSLHVGETRDRSAAIRRRLIPDAVHLGRESLADCARPPERLSHCMALTEEDMKLINAAGIAIEVNLTSNEILCGGKPKDHPVHMMKGKVPSTLGPDDELHFVTSQGHECAKGIMDYSMTHRDIMNSNRVGLHKCDLPGESIYDCVNGKCTIKPLFKGINKKGYQPSAEASAVLQRSKKAQVSQKLELAMAEANAKIAEESLLRGRSGSGEKKGSPQGTARTLT